MSLWIERKKNGILIVPLPALSDNVRGDGVVEIKPTDADYSKYLKLYEEEQERRKQV